MFELRKSNCVKAGISLESSLWQQITNYFTTDMDNSNLNLLSDLHPYVSMKSFIKNHNKVSINDFHYSNQFNKELFYNNVDTSKLLIDI
ncbi:hypothetical protein D3C73_1574830 [compost metagenome]